MCTACEWAPHFAAFGRDGPVSRRTILRTAAVTAVVATAAACTTEPASGSQDQPIQPVPANFVFHNGRVYTVREAMPWAEAVVVTHNSITYVGDSAGALTFAGPTPRSSTWTASC